MTLNKHIADHVRDIPRSGIRDFFEIVAAMKDVISLGIGEPDFDTPWHIREAAIYGLERGHTGYTSNLGLPELRERIAQYVAQALPRRATIRRRRSSSPSASARRSTSPCARCSIPATRCSTTSRAT